MIVHADLNQHGPIESLCNATQPGDLYIWVPVESVRRNEMPGVNCPRCQAVAAKASLGITLNAARAEEGYP